MSDMGLFGSVYEQLREYSEQLDELLLKLRGNDQAQRARARQELAALLRGIGDSQNKRPAAQVIRTVLRRKLESAKTETICQDLAASLERHDPTTQELDSLEKIALAVDSERHETMSRMRGRPCNSNPKETK